MQARVRIGVIGAGRWGRNLIRAFGGLERCEVAAVCDTDPKQLADLVLPKTTLRLSDLAQLLEGRTVQAVVIATPAAIHATQTIVALGAGKHVFVEKPMAASLRDAQRMRDASVGAGRCLMVGHLLRYHPAILELRRLIEAGNLGEIQRVVALRLGPRGARNDECPWWSLAPHDVSLVRYLLDAEVTEVSATRRDFADGGSEVSARLGLQRGFAELVVGNAHLRKTRRLVVFGTERTAMFDDGGRLPILMSLEGSYGPPRDLPAELIASWEPIGASGRVPFQPAEPLLSEATHFVSAVLRGGRIATDADEGCAVIAVLEAGAASMSCSGAWIKVSAPALHATPSPEHAMTDFA